MRPFFHRKLWESIFLLTLKNVFRTESVHWDSLGFVLVWFFCQCGYDKLWLHTQAEQAPRLGTFCPNSSCVRSSCFPAAYKHGHTGFSKTGPRRSHTAAFPMTLQPLPKQLRLPAKRLNNCFSQKLCSWCPISYQNDLPVPWVGKSPWEINYSKKQPNKPHTHKKKIKRKRKEDRVGGGNREREE